MRGDNQKINVRYKDTGQVSRIPRFKADSLVDSGRAEFVSNSIRKAFQAGVPVTKGMTDTQIKSAIAEARKPKEKSSEDESNQSKRGSKRPRKQNSTG